MTVWGMMKKQFEDGLGIPSFTYTVYPCVAWAEDTMKVEGPLLSGYQIEFDDHSDQISFPWFPYGFLGFPHGCPMVS